MTDEEYDNMNQDDPTELRYRSLFENDHIQTFLRRHGLTTDGEVPLRKEEIEKRLKQIDDQNSLDLVTQSLIEKALGIKRPLRKSYKHTTTRNSKQPIEHNPYITIYDNSCAMTMIYCEARTSRNKDLYTFKVQGDEIIVMQYQTSAGSIMVYKGFLTPNEEFTFKSHRSPDTPFTIAIYINGVIDSRISTCCEQGYLKQRNSHSKRSLFQVLFVCGGNPCFTCQANDLMESSISDNEEAESEWISIVNSTQELLSSSPSSVQITPSTPKPFLETNFTKKHKTKSGSKSSIISAKLVKKSPNPSNSISMEIEALPEAIEKQLTATEPPQAKANEIQTTTTAEKMITTEETDKQLKNEIQKEDELFKQMNEMINETDNANSKENKNDPVLMKISNEEEEEEGHGLGPSVANHEMQQLLSKYLLLLLPQPKLQGNNDDIEPVVMTTSVSNNQESANVIQQLVLPIPQHSQREMDSKMASFDASQLSSQRENVESLVLIWLDITINKNDDTIISQTKLRAIVNSLLTFHTVDDTINFIKNVKEEKVFLIISGTLGWELIKRTEMNELSQLDSIYVFCHDESKHKVLMEREYKVRGIFTSIDPLCLRLKEDMKQTLNDLLPISVAPNTSNKDKSIVDKEKQVIFLCAQLHRELLFTMEYSDDARLELVEFCAKSYQDNDTERAFIKELQKDYHTGKAVWWYTRPSFLYKMLNTALFRQDIPMLYKFHFFIKDLHMQLEQLHNLYKPSLESRTFTVYRGLGMSMKIFDETIRKGVNNLLAFDTFLSTSLNKDTALQFAKNKSNADDESILLQIEIDTDKLQRPFADVSRLSAFKCEDEILFSMGTVFHIDHVAEKKTSDGIWLVRLSSIDENDKQLTNETKQTHSTLLNFFKRVWKAQMKRGDRRHIAISYVNMASMYYKQGIYQKSLDLYQKALENLKESSSSNLLTISTYQSNIAMVYMALKKQDDALKLYEQALKSQIELCEPNDPLLINTLHTIGHIYRGNKEFDKALKHYNRALELQPISLEPPLKHNPSSIAATHINIALVYHQQYMTTQALEHFSKAFAYQREYLSEYHPILAFLYNNIGAMHYRLKNYDLALKNQLLTLQIEERSLPKEHKTLAVTYTNIATSYEQLQRYDEAIDYAQKAVNQLKFHSSENNSDIQTKQAYLDRLLIDKEIFQDK